MKISTRIHRRGLAAALAALLVAGATTSTASVLTSRGSQARPGSQQALDVLPFPNTPDAAPGAKIDFPAVSPAQIARVVAIGSRSGPHSGRLGAQPAGHGSAFSPARPFAPGEQVSVTATFRSSQAATATGARATRTVRFSFGVARLQSAADRPSPASVVDGSPGFRGGPNSKPLTHSFVTEPGFKVPNLHISGKDTYPAGGDMFLDSQSSPQNAAYILDPLGHLLWYRPTTGQAVRIVREQTFKGRPVLTYWQGQQVVPPGGGRGNDVILNEHYKTLHTVTAGNGYKSQGADSHDFVLGHDGSEAVAFITIFSPVQHNLRSVGGPPNGMVYDWIIQEIDIATGKVVWEWHTLGHIPLRYTYSHYTPGRTLDYFHLNSIQQLPHGHLLISSRDTWSVYDIDQATGKVVWKLGGKHSSFKMEPGTQFAFQHDATLNPNDVLTLFNDESPSRAQSRALVLQIKRKLNEVTLVHSYTHSPAAFASSEGSVQILPNHNVFVGWGASPFVSEYRMTGGQVFGISYRAPLHTDRAYRFHWVGKPLQPPAIAVRHSTKAGEDIVYASWNGATQVARWQLLTSSRKTGPFSKRGSPFSWSGFQSSIQTTAAGYFKVEALASDGHVLGTSAAATAP